MKANVEIILKAWRQEKFEPVYLFHGGEEFIIDQLCHSCIQLALEPGAKDFDLNILYGHETDAATIVNYACAYPMMSKRRVVIVKDIHRLDAAGLELLAKYAQRPHSSTCLLLTAEKIDARKSAVKRLLEHSTNLEIKPLYDNEVPQWLQQYVHDMNLTISPEAIRLLQGTVGNLLRRLATEVEKIRINLRDRKRIEVEDVELVVGRNRQYSIFELCDAIGRRRIHQSIVILRQLLRQGEAPAGIVAMLTRHFGILMRIKALKAHKSAEKSIAQELAINPFFIKNYLAQADLFSSQQISQAFHHLLEADDRLKTSQGKPALVMELLLMNLQVNNIHLEVGTFINSNG